MTRAIDLTDVARFWTKVERTEGDSCWPWLGTRLPTGRGQFVRGRVEGKLIRVSAPRMAWELTHGAIPAGQCVCHTCDQPNCVNPSHLFLASQAENIRDSIRKGRYNTYGLQKLNATQVLEIRAQVAAGARHRDVAATFGLARTTVTNIANRRIWAHLSAVERVPAGARGSVI